MSNFVHLHSHSEYSALDGLGRIDDIVGRAKELGHKAIAITDHGTSAGLFKLYNSCKESGIKPILGVEFYTTKDMKRKRLPIHKFENLIHTLLSEEEKKIVDNIILNIAFLTGVYEDHEYVEYSKKKYVNFEEELLDLQSELEYYKDGYIPEKFYDRMIDIYKGAFKFSKRTFDKLVRDTEKKLDIADRRHLVVLAKNFEGVKALYRLVSESNLKGWHNYWNLPDHIDKGKPRIDEKALYKEYEKTNKSLVILSACTGGIIAKEFTKNGAESAYNLSKYYKDRYSDDFFLEVQPHILYGTLDDREDSEKDVQLEINKTLFRIGRSLDIPVVATNDNHWILEEHEESQQVLLALNNKEKWDNPHRFKFSTTGFHMRTEEEMIKQFKKQGWPDRLIEEYIKPALDENIGKLLDKIDIEYPTFEVLLPDFDLPKEVEKMDKSEFIDELKEFGFSDLSIWEVGAS